MKHLWNKRKPCEECLYKRELIKTPINPCPQCMLSGYKTFEKFNKQLSKKHK